MIIEVLYPSLANLYGETTAIAYLRQCLPQAEIIPTEINEEPAFVTKPVNMVFLGGMTENTQELVLEKLLPYKKHIQDVIERQIVFLALSNAMELFGEYIEKEDGTKIQALGLFPTYAKRHMDVRYNSLVLGQMEGFKLLGFKSQFSDSYGDNSQNYLFQVLRGSGLNPGSKLEGLRRHNFMATYLLGPMLVLNPAFTKYILKLLGAEVEQLPYEASLQEAFNRRLVEFEDQNTRY